MMVFAGKHLSEGQKLHSANQRQIVTDLPKWTPPGRWTGVCVSTGCAWPLLSLYHRCSRYVGLPKSCPGKMETVVMVSNWKRPLGLQLTRSCWLRYDVLPAVGLGKTVSYLTWKQRKHLIGPCDADVLLAQFHFQFSKILPFVLSCGPAPSHHPGGC